MAKKHTIPERVPMLPTPAPKMQYKFQLAYADSILEFESIVGLMINDGWELSGELIVTPLPYDPSDPKQSGAFMRYTQPLVKAVRVDAEEA